MSERLIIKDIGPIKSVDLSLAKINLFIGKNQVGKSIASKILQIKRVDGSFKNFGLDGYRIDENNIKYTTDDKTATKISKDRIIKYIKKHINNEEDLLTLLKEIESNHSLRYNSIYIPAERTLVPFLTAYGINFYSAKIPLPSYILDFASIFRLAKDEIKELSILDVLYRFENSEDRVYISDSEYIDLKSASSGIQTILPLYLVMLFDNQKRYIIEEPELNLFPTEQFELLKFMISNSDALTIATHSPYILSGLNILLYAHNVAHKDSSFYKKVDKIIPSKYWIDPNEFSAYLFDNGEAVSILENGLISDNAIDDASDYYNDIFDEISEIEYDKR